MARVSQAAGTAEATAALKLIDEPPRRGVKVVLPGLCKGYDSGAFMIKLEQHGVTPHIAIDFKVLDRLSVGGHGRCSKANRLKIGARHRMHQRLRDAAFIAGQRARKKIEKGFGWHEVSARFPWWKVD